MIVPPDNFRPYLSSFQGTNFTDYINAVFVDGYTHPREYIVTEWPLASTVPDIWSMVYDHDCSAVVVLCNPEASPSFPHFWPESTRSKKYGTVFTVEHISHQHYQNIKSWVFKINKKIVSLTDLMAGVKAESKTCQLFQLTCWPDGYKVPHIHQRARRADEHGGRGGDNAPATGPSLSSRPTGSAGRACTARQTPASSRWSSTARWTCSRR
ncbi:receptor-type tyrosine-protein phosphatase U-like [Pollicipes pollicipes]|uniref:receptor-type tyrosine-protein phosphatase U-like n=1 Tax=Pollicipes pollicipes TaxID=41117 RepID=UPI001884C35F|nr:receptor-type tyrosine-protein phosphatase U-like [Pollicipes pollicipes]